MSAKLGTAVLVQVSTDNITFTTIAKQQGGTLTHAGSPADISNKDSSQNAEAIPGFTNWEVSCSGVYNEADAGYEIVRASLAAKTTIYGKFLETGGAKTRTGAVIVTDCSTDAPHDAAATYSITLQGTGLLSVS